MQPIQQAFKKKTAPFLQPNEQVFDLQVQVNFESRHVNLTMPQAVPPEQSKHQNSSSLQLLESNDTSEEEGVECVLCQRVITPDKFALHLDVHRRKKISCSTSSGVQSAISIGQSARLATFMMSPKSQNTPKLMSTPRSPSKSEWTDSPQIIPYRTDPFPYSFLYAQKITKEPDRPVETKILIEAKVPSMEPLKSSQIIRFNKNSPPTVSREEIKQSNFQPGHQIPQPLLYPPVYQPVYQVYQPVCQPVCQPVSQATLMYGSGIFERHPVINSLRQSLQGGSLPNYVTLIESEIQPQQLLVNRDSMRQSVVSECGSSKASSRHQFAQLATFCKPPSQKSCTNQERTEFTRERREFTRDNNWSASPSFMNNTISNNINRQRVGSRSPGQSQRNQSEIFNHECPPHDSNFLDDSISSIGSRQSNPRNSRPMSPNSVSLGLSRFNLEASEQYLRSFGRSQKSQGSLQSQQSETLTRSKIPVNYLAREEFITSVSSEGGKQRDSKHT